MNEQTTSEAKAAPQPKRNVLTLVLAAVAIAAVALIGGIAIGQSTAGNQSGRPGQFPGGVTGDGAFGGMPGSGENGQDATLGGFAAGTIVSVDQDRIVIETAQGEQRTILLGDDVAITVSQAGSLQDLQAGDSVVIQGEADADGTVTAASIREGELGGSFMPGMPGAFGDRGQTGAAPSRQ